MKYLSLLLVLPAFVLLGLKPAEKIPECYLSYKGPKGLTAQPHERLPETSGGRVIMTDSGEVSVSRLDGYRIFYTNKHRAPFVNLKVELSRAGHFADDKRRLVANLKYLVKRSAGMERKDIIELNSNGYTLYGLSRNSLEAGNTLGTYIMFPAENVVVYFYFNNMQPAVRNFSSLEDYQKQRDAFFDAYTKHLKECK